MARSQPDAVPAPLVIHDNISVLTTDDPLLLTELKADRKIGPLLLVQLSDTSVVVAPGSEDALTRHLLKAGHLPKIRRPGA